MHRVSVAPFGDVPVLAEKPLFLLKELFLSVDVDNTHGLSFLEELFEGIGFICVVFEVICEGLARGLPDHRHKFALVLVYAGEPLVYVSQHGGLDTFIKRSHLVQLLLEVVEGLRKFPALGVYLLRTLDKLIVKELVSVRYVQELGADHCRVVTHLNLRFSF